MGEKEVAIGALIYSVFTFALYITMGSLMMSMDNFVNRSLGISSY